MIVREPSTDHRDEQPYAGLRKTVAMADLPTFIPASIEAVFSWLGQHGIAPAGAPFLRYHTVEMPGRLDVELGVPVNATVVPGDEVGAGMLPAGRYVSLIYRDVSKGIESNRALFEWANVHNLLIDSAPGPAGDEFAARYERFLSGPADSPDPATWDTEVAMRLRD